MDGDRVEADACCGINCAGTILTASWEAGSMLMANWGGVLISYCWQTAEKELGWSKAAKETSSEWA